MTLEDNMKSEIKLLIADRSAVVRRILSEVVGQHPLIRVVFQARNGAEALGAFPGCRPDVVLLDIEMPVMNGLDTLTAIHAMAPDVPVIMFSSLTRSGAEETLTALSLGASDYETKPSMVGHIDEAREHIARLLVPKIVNWGLKRRAPKQYTARETVQTPNLSGLSARSMCPIQNTEIVVVGASTGGPEALKLFLGEFPVDFAVPILVVQHMPPVFTRTLANRLNASCSLHVSEAAEGSAIESGKVLIAPGGYHMTIGRSGLDSVVKLNQDEAVNFCRPAVDVLFNSAVGIYGGNCLAVVLTGMGRDGLDGAREIVAKGGKVMIQDEASSVVWGMPGAISQAELECCSLPPVELARRVVDAAPRVRHLVPVGNGEGI